MRAQEVPVPEPDLTPETVIGRARALIPAIRAQQDEAERLGHHTPELDRQFAEAGFYRILQPRRYGGYEFGLPVFWRVMLAVSAGDPGTGWGLTLGAHHALVVGAWFSEAGQRDIFGPLGDFRGPHRAPPVGTAEPADGGYVVSGTWDYCSGIAHATHFMGNAMVAGTSDRIAVVIPRDQVTVLDDWGGGATLGMNASGSNSVRADAVFVPAHRTAPADWTHGDTQAPGAALHGSPLYCGRIYAVYHAGLVIPVIGAARAALALLPGRGHVPRPHRRAGPDHRGRTGPCALRPAGQPVLSHRPPCPSRFPAQRGAPMARRTSPPFRANHVGSLLRPPALLAARAGFAAGAITANQLRQAEDDAIRDAVRMQEQTGLQAATDGEFRRAEWHTDFITRLGGIRAAGAANSVPVFSRPALSEPGRPTMTYQAHGTEVTGQVHLAETIFADHFGFLASAVTTAVPKLTIPSPSMAHFRADISASGYADSAEFRADLASAYAAEIAALAGLGCSYLQLDDTP